MSKIFKAIVTREKEGEFISRVEERKISDLPNGDVLINVKYSSLNYKDALSASGNKGVTKHYPFTPGIDAAGIIEETDSKLFRKGDEVIVTGFDLGMNTSGGFGGYIRVPSSWVVKLPENLSLKESMIYGTAGLAAGLSLYQLQYANVKSEDGEVLVTGASGGVGSMAVAILANAGYKVIAATGKEDAKEYLLKLGAAGIINRDELLNEKNKSLLKSRWSGAIDTVGGEILSSVIASTKYRGAVVACGNARSHILNTTVYPFILRAIKLIGVSTEKTPMDLRVDIWNKLATEWKPDSLEDMYEECSLTETIDRIKQILQGRIKGRVLVNPYKL